jgi:hypothetical protein
MKTVYIETSIVSYLTARPTRSILAAAWQQATEDWWSFQRSRFELFTSELVVNAEKKPVIRSVCAAKGYQCPEICTPMELMGETEDER